MDLKNISLFKTLNQKMTWLNERQQVLAQNIANANTPGYIAQDLEEVSFEQYLNETNMTDSGQQRTIMKTSDPRHMNMSGGSSASFEIRQTTSDFAQASPDGNTVDLERELTKMAEVQMEYTLASNMYKKHIGMLRMSLGRRQ